MKVVSAAVAVDVQHFTAGENPGGDAAFQRIGAELRRADAAGGDLCAVHAHHAGHFQCKALDKAADGVKLTVCQRRERPGCIKTGAADDGLAQTRL